jgi:hypothetical protein
VLWSDSSSILARIWGPCTEEGRVLVAKRLDCGDLSPLSHPFDTKLKAPMNRRTPKPGGSSAGSWSAHEKRKSFLADGLAFGLDDP